MDLGLPLTGIEDALVEALVPLKDSHGVATLKGYEGELSSAEELSAAIPRFPGVLVVYVGSRFVPDEGGGGRVEHMTWTVLVADKSLRSKAEAKKGGGQTTGCYELLGGVKAALWGGIVAPGLAPAELTRQEVIFQDSGLAVYAAVFEIEQRVSPY